MNYLADKIKARKGRVEVPVSVTKHTEFGGGITNMKHNAIWFLLLILPLSWATATAWAGDAPELPECYVLAGISGFAVEVDIQSKDQNVLGTSSFYKSLISNLLSQHGVPIYYGNDYNPHFRRLSLTILGLAHTLKLTGNKTGSVSWVASLRVVEGLECRLRLDSSNRPIRVPSIDAPIWNRQALLYDNEQTNVTVRTKQVLDEWVNELVAALREANNPSTFQAIQRYVTYVDSLTSEMLKRDTVYQKLIRASDSTFTPKKNGAKKP